MKIEEDTGQYLDSDRAEMKVFMTDGELKNYVDLAFTLLRHRMVTGDHETLLSKIKSVTIKHAAITRKRICWMIMACEEAGIPIPANLDIGYLDTETSECVRDCWVERGVTRTPVYNRKDADGNWIPLDGKYTMTHHKYASDKAKKRYQTKINKYVGKALSTWDRDEIIQLTTPDTIDSAKIKSYKALRTRLLRLGKFEKFKEGEPAT